MAAAGDRIGPYEVRGRLGAGGMGEVFRAHDPRLGRDVAIKVLPAALRDDPDRLRRFESEARATGALSHPNVLAVHDFGVHDGAPYLVSELLEGETLRQRLARGPLPARKAAEIAAQICRGLSAAHAKGILHRDLKPDNLFLGADGLTKILDFGLAKVAPSPSAASGPTLSEGTGSGAILGSVGYMSPEQIRGQPADSRSDLFALGAILHEMLGGSRAFNGETAVEVGYATLNHDPPDLPGVTPSLQRVVRRCLEKAPAERFQTAQDLAFALESAASDSAVSVVTGPAPRAPARPRGSIVLAGLVLVAVAAGAFWLGGRTPERRPRPARPAPAARPAPPPAPRSTRVMFRTGFVASARFADEGRSVVYAAELEGEPMYVFQETPGQPEARRISEPWTAVYAVSRQGKVALGSAPAPSGSLSDWTLAEASLAGGGARPIARGVIDADYAPDGSLLRVTFSDGRCRLEAGGKVLAQSDGLIRFARFSPSGDAIAFLHQPVPGDDRGTVELVTLTGQRRTLSGPWYSAAGLAWAPSGREIWYTAANDSGLRLRAVTRDGQDRIVYAAPGRLQLWDIAPDGRVLVEDVDHRYRMYGRVPGRDAEIPLSWFDGSVPIDLTADGRMLLFLEGLAASGTEVRTYVRSTDGAPAVRLADGYGRALSPDGRWALVSTAEPFDTLTLVPTGPGEPRTLEKGTASPLYSARFFADGRRILIHGREPGGAARLWIQDVASGAPRRVGGEGLPSVENVTAPSPDGRTVAALDLERRPVLVSLETGVAAPIEGLGAGDKPLGWSEDGRSLFVWPASGTRAAWPVRVFRFDLATRARSPWRAIEPRELAGVPALFGGIECLKITPDGQWYVLQYSRSAGNLYVMEGLR